MGFILAVRSNFARRLNNALFKFKQASLVNIKPHVIQARMPSWMNGFSEIWRQGFSPQFMRFHRHWNAKVPHKKYPQWALDLDVPHVQSKRRTHKARHSPLSAEQKRTFGEINHYSLKYFPSRVTDRSNLNWDNESKWSLIRIRSIDNYEFFFIRKCLMFNDVKTLLFMWKSKDNQCGQSTYIGISHSTNFCWIFDCFWQGNWWLVY